VAEQRLGQHRPAVQDGEQRLDQGLGIRGLREEARGARPQGLDGRVLIGHAGDGHDPHGRLDPADGRDGPTPARRGHLDVDDRDVGTEPLHERRRGRGVLRGAHDTDPAVAHLRQEQGEAPGEKWMVVHQNHVHRVPA
jgi:hypothetical protein